MHTHKHSMSGTVYFTNTILLKLLKYILWGTNRRNICGNITCPDPFTLPFPAETIKPINRLKYYSMYVPRLSPHPNKKQNRRGRAWYQFTCDIVTWQCHSIKICKVVTQLYSHIICWLKQLWYYYWRKWGASLWVRLCHSSDNWEVPSMEVSLFPITKFHFDKIVTKLWRKTLVA